MKTSSLNILLILKIMAKLQEHEDYFTPFPRVGESLPAYWRGMGLGADHLGNVRDVITTDTAYSNSNTQETDYYPFGQEIPISSISDNQLKYNGKELQDKANLDWYDYRRRFYDPVICRFTTSDPVAEFFPWMTNYQYASSYNSPYS